MSANYKDHQYEKQNLNTIRAMSEVEKRDDGLKKIVDDLHEYLQEEYDVLVEEILLGKKSKSKLEAVINDWLSNKDGISQGFVKENLIKKLLDNIVGWGILQPLIDDLNITNIFTNERLEVIKRVKGQDLKTNIKFENEEELEVYIKAVMIRTKQKIGRDVCLQDVMDHIHRVRINAGISGSSIKQEVVRKPYIALRTYRVSDYSRDFFIGNETFSSEIADFIEENMMDSNVIFVGEPDAGKTTLIEYFRNLKIVKDPMRRVIRIEEEAELNFQSENSVSFFERKTSGNKDDTRKKYDMAEFARVATRLAGKDVIVGEVRGGEAWWLTRLLDMGYKGEASVHGSSAKSAIDQLAFLMSLEAPNVRMDMLIRRICEIVDFIVYVSSKKIVTIAEIERYNTETSEPELNNIFELDIDDNGKLFWKQGKLSDRFSKKKKISEALKTRRV